MAEHYYTVGVHGAPTPETAPHGFRWRAATGQRWFYGDFADVPMNANDQWQPLPPPPTEQAPPPEPVARWFAKNDRASGGGKLWTRDGAPSLRMIEEVAEDLNAIDRDGVAWGPGRPMEELPDGHRERVLLADPSGHMWIDSGTHRGFDEKAMRAGWWPLPLPREATT